MKKAIVFGASGFIGSYLLDYLLNSTDYEEVTVVVRKKLNINHPKLKTLIGDYHSLSELKEQLQANQVFITLGTTKVKTPDKKEYYQIDHDYPVLAAKIAKEKAAQSVFLVSSVGANAQSNVFYIKTKGETEQDIINLQFEHTYIFSPSMIMGSRKENRPLEKFMIKLWASINPLLFGKNLKKYKGIEGKDIARAMFNAAKSPAEKIKINHWQEMQDLNQKQA